MADIQNRTETCLKFVVNSAPAYGPPETLTHPKLGPVLWETPELPSEDLSAEEKIRWFTARTAATCDEKGIGAQIYYSQQVAGLVEDPSINPEAKCLQDYVAKFVDAFTGLQQTVVQKGFSEDLSPLAVIDFRENSKNFFLELDKQGILTETQKQKLLKEGKLPLDLLKKQREEQEALGAAEHDAMLGNVYDAVCSISHFLPHFGFSEVLATKVTADLSRLAPGAFRLMRRFQEKTSVVEGRGVLHSSKHDKTLSLARNLFNRSALGGAVAGVVIGAMLVAEAPVTVPIMAGAFAVGAVLPSLRPGKIDWGAGAKSLLRGVVPGAVYLGAGALLAAVSPELAAGTISATVGLVLMRALAGGTFAGLGVSIGAEATMNAFNRKKAAADELCKYLYFSGPENNLEQTQKLLSAEQGRGEVRHFLGKEVPMWGKKGWEVIARLVNGEQLTSAELDSCLQKVRDIRLQISADMGRNPGRFNYLLVDLGKGERALIDRRKFFLERLNSLEDLAMILGGSLAPTIEVGEIERKISQDVQTAAAVNVGMAFGGALLTRAARAIGATMDADTYWSAVKQTLTERPLNLSWVKLFKDARVGTNVLGLELSGGGGEIPTTSLTRAATDLEGLDLLTNAPKKNPLLMKNALAMIAVKELDFTSYTDFLKTQRLTPADVRAFASVLEERNIQADPFVDALRENGTSAKSLAKFVQSQPDFNSQVHRVVKNYGLSGKLYRFADNGTGLLERLEINRADPDVQLLAAGVEPDRVAGIIAKPGGIVQDGNVILIRSSTTVVAEIPAGNEKLVETNLGLINKVLASDNTELLKASNNANVSYGKFLAYATATNKWPNGYPKPDSYPSVFYLVEQSIGAKNKDLLQKAIAGDPRAFNQVAGMIKDKNALALLKQNQFHAAPGNPVMYDIFDRVTDKNSLIKRVGFYARKWGAEPISANSVADPFGAERIVGGTPVDYDSLTVGDILDGGVSVDEAIRAAVIKGGKAPAFLVDQAGVEAQSYPAANIPLENYSDRTLQLLRATEGSMSQDYKNNGKVYLVQLFRKNLTSGTEKGGTVPAVGLLKKLGLPVTANGMNEFGAPALPGVYHPEKYSVEYARELMRKIFNDDGIGVSSISPVSDLMLWDLAENYLRIRIGDDPDKVARMCIDLESFIVMRGQPEEAWETAYLNYVNTGSRYGVPFLGLNTVAEKTFGGNLDNLSWGRKAIVFSLPQGPVSQVVTQSGAIYYTYGGNNGIDKPGLDENQLTAKLIDRGRFILNRWWNKGAISDEEYNQGVSELDILASIKQPIFWKVPEDLKSTDLGTVRTVFTTLPTVISTSAGNIVAEGYVQGHELSGIVATAVPENLKYKLPFPKAELQKYVDDAVAGFTRKGNIWYGPVGKDGKSIGMFPDFETPDGKHYPGIQIVVAGPDGEILARGGAADVFSERIQPGSTIKLLAAAWLKKRGVDVEKELFDNSPGTDADLVGSGLPVENPAGSGIYAAMAKKSAGNKLTILQDLRVSSNAAIMRAFRRELQRDPDAWIDWQRTLGLAGMSQEVGGVPALEPTSHALMGSDAEVPLDGYMRALAWFANPDLCPDAKMREGVKTVVKGMTDDKNLTNLKVDGYSAAGLTKVFGSSVNGNPDALMVKTGTVAEPVNGKLISKTTLAVTEGEVTADGKRITVLVRAVKMKMVNGKWVQAPVQDDVGQSNAEGSTMAAPTARDLAKKIGQRTGGIPPEAVPGKAGIPSTYVIQRGDTLSAIAAKYNLTVDELIGDNPGIKPNQLRIGSTINLTVPVLPRALPAPAVPPVVPPIPAPAPSGVIN